MEKNQLDAMNGEAVNRGRLGWAVDWPSGYTSAMPNEATARACAAAPDLLALLSESLMYVEETEQFHKPECRTLSKRIKAAIARAEGN